MYLKKSSAICLTLSKGINFEQNVNPNWHEAGVKVPSQHPISILKKLSFFSSKFSFRPRGVMDKAVGYGAEGPWFDPCLGQSFFSDLDNM